MDIRRLIISLPAIMALWGGLASCDKMIYDNYDDCLFEEYMSTSILRLSVPKILLILWKLPD